MRVATEIDHIIFRLKNGEYDGADIMRAWCNLRQLQSERDELKKRVEELEGAIRDHCYAYLHNGCLDDYPNHRLWETLEKGEK